MFQEAQADPHLALADAKRLEAELRIKLLNEQYRHLELKDRSLLILVSGIDGAGKSETINLLNEWMDPRHIHTVAFAPPSKDEQDFPLAKRFWMSLPAKGEIGIVYGAGYAPLLEEAMRKNPNREKITKVVLYLRRFEANLAANGVQLIKLWFHMSRKAQAKRTADLLANPSTAWQVNEVDKKVYKNFEKLSNAGQTIIEATDAHYSPWIVIPSADPNVRTVRTAQAILQAFKQRSIKVPPLHNPGAALPLKQRTNILDKVDYGLTLSKIDYEEQVLHWQNRLAQLVRGKKFKKQGLVLVFEGNDAAGKGGAIRRVTRAIDARQFNVMPVSAPKNEELARPYLWRFWNNIPRRGRISIFDRSWYGRVLVERVEKLISRTAWTRSYDEINDFEQHLTDHGIVVVKFWLAITADEQLRRFREREHSPFKQFKLTPDDWRNRRKWNAYVGAAKEMFTHTNTKNAPWHVLSANDKRYARVEVLKRVVQAIETAQNTKA
jgi:polyphosphate:AMP phosphotransferase